MSDLAEQSIHDIFESAGEEHREWFDLYEPWDNEERSPELIALAEKYGVSLDIAASLFQTGAMLSTSFITVSLAGNQSGKSINEVVQTIIQCTGVVPISLRTPRGEKTNKLREYENPKYRELNVKRFGRFDAKTGDFIDKDTEAKQDGTWNCGYVHGVGIYPAKKMPPGPQEVWICCPTKVLQNNWVPTFIELWPERLRDMDRYQQGYSDTKKQFFSSNGSVVTFITYESGYAAIEGRKVLKIVCDEEPPDRRFWSGLLTHAKYIVTQFTPIHGMSWAKAMIVDMAKDEKASISVFHTTGFDSPYLDDSDLMTQMASMAQWEVKPKIFGHFAPQTSEDPYFDRNKLMSWMRRWVPTHTHGTIEALAEWNKPRDIIDTEVEFKPIFPSMKPHDALKQGNVWELYEFPRPESTYYAAIDTAKGDSNFDAGRTSDASVCLIRRVKEGKEKYDPIVAVLETLDSPMSFFRMVMPAARYYNNCLICPEETSEPGYVFVQNLVPEFGGGYPYVLKMTVVKDATRKTTEAIGWVNRGGKVRRQAFDCAKDFINDFDVDQDPAIPNLRLLEQFVNCIRGKNGRPDHPKREHDDVLLSFVISEWVAKYASAQIKNNYKPMDSGVPSDRTAYEGDPVETRPVLSRRGGLDSRARAGLHQRR